MGDVGCYCLNFCRALMGFEPTSWHAHVRYDPHGVDMEALVRLIFAPQQTAQIFCSFTTNGSFAVGHRGQRLFAYSRTVCVSRWAERIPLFGQRRANA